MPLDYVYINEAAIMRAPGPEVSEIRQLELDELQSNMEATPGPGSYSGMYHKSSFVNRQIN